MSRKLFAALLGLTGLLIGLGAFGHSFMGRQTLDIGLARVALDAHTDKLIYLIWYFCGGCMLVFGLLVIAGAWQAWRGAACGPYVSGLIGIFYSLAGVLALAYLRELFWSVFVILGACAFGFSLLPAKTAGPAATG